MVKHILFSIALVTSALLSSLALADDCDGPLRGGVFDVVETRSLDTLDEDLFTFLKESTRHEIERAMNAGLKVPTKAGVIGGSFSKKQWDDFESERTAWTRSEIKKMSAREILSTTASSVILDAWIRCRELSQYGWCKKVSYFSGSDGKPGTGTLTIRWTSTPNCAAAAPPKIRKVTTQNFTIEADDLKSLKDKELRPGSDVVILFSRPDEDQVGTIKLETDTAADLSVSVPAYKRPPKRHRLTARIVSHRHSWTEIDGGANGYEFQIASSLVARGGSTGVPADAAYSTVQTGPVSVFDGVQASLVLSEADGPLPTSAEVHVYFRVQSFNCPAGKPCDIGIVSIPIPAAGVTSTKTWNYSGIGSFQGTNGKPPARGAIDIELRHEVVSGE